MPADLINRHLRLRRVGRTSFCVVLSVVFVGIALAGATTCSAQTVAAPPAVERAASALRTNNIYSEPGADPGLSGGDVARLRRVIGASDSGPVYIAVLSPGASQEAGGDAGSLAQEIGRRVRRPGTYAVVSGTRIGAASSVLSRGEAGTLAREAANAYRGGSPAVVLEDFVRRVGEARSGASRGGGSSGGGLVGLGFLAVIVAVAAAVLGLNGRRRRREQQAELAEVKETAWDDLVALGDDIRALELDVDMPSADARAKDDYGRAVASYQSAERAYEAARRPADLEAVTSALEEGRYAITSAKARLEGREPPERRPPCFFDPRHGPSAREVEWAPPEGSPRTIPACAADAVRIEEGREPATREIMVGGRRLPYWQAPPYYGPWAGGFFGGLGGGLLPGLFLGSMLGSGMGLGWGAGEAWGAGDMGGFGGGDFCGGDFGGGDF
jgi:hypothetical protein